MFLFLSVDKTIDWKDKVYHFHTDPGHGWLAVKLAELERLNIRDKITGFSYVRGKTVYLEEDCDLSTFIEAKKAKGEPVVYKTSYRENSPIRSYNSFA